MHIPGALSGAWAAQRERNPKLRTFSRLPLEAECETIWIVHKKLLHAVGRNGWLFDFDSLTSQMIVNRIDIGSAKK